MIFGPEALTLVTKLLHDPTIVDATSIVGWGRNTCGPVYGMIILVRLIEVQ
jgi:hypothetical protein